MKHCAELAGIPVATGQNEGTLHFHGKVYIVRELVLMQYNNVAILYWHCNTKGQG